MREMQKMKAMLALVAAGAVASVSSLATAGTITLPAQSFSTISASGLNAVGGVIGKSSTVSFDKYNLSYPLTGITFNLDVNYGAYLTVGNPTLQPLSFTSASASQFLSLKSSATGTTDLAPLTVTKAVTGFTTIPSFVFQSYPGAVGGTHFYENGSTNVTNAVAPGFLASFLGSGAVNFTLAFAPTGSYTGDSAALLYGGDAIAYGNTKLSITYQYDDHTNITPVPLPSSAAMGGAGLGLTLLLKARRNRRSNSL